MEGKGKKTGAKHGCQHWFETLCGPSLRQVGGKVMKKRAKGQHYAKKSGRRVVSKIQPEARIGMI